MTDQGATGEDSRAPLLTVLTGAEVYAPEPLGVRAVVVVGGRIAALGPVAPGSWPAEVTSTIDLSGSVLVPGLVDGHVHFLGGGGGDGYDSRAPELQLSHFTLNGVTTAVAPLGIDPVSRSLEGLLAKARALTSAGISAYIYSGGFRKPLLNLTGSPWRDAYLVPDVVGVKLAIGVERAPVHKTTELANLARELLWVERATGRRLVLHVHLGLLAEGHRLVRDLASALVEPDRLVVTHLNRTERHVETALALTQLGAWADMTGMISPERGYPGSLPASLAIRRLADGGATLDRVSLSSDGNGSVPERRPDGRWAEYTTHMDSLLAELRQLVDGGLPIERAVALVTLNPARALGLAAKGRIASRADADLVALGPGLVVRDVFAGGRRLVADGQPAALGRYEMIGG